MGWEVGGKFKEEGTYVYLWLIHVDVWQKPTQYCKAIILQLKINKLKKKRSRVRSSVMTKQREKGLFEVPCTFKIWGCCFLFCFVFLLSSFCEVKTQSFFHGLSERCTLLSS